MVLPNGTVIESNDQTAHLRPSRRIRTGHVLTVLRNSMARIHPPPRPMEEDLTFTQPIPIHKMLVPVQAPSGVMMNTQHPVQVTADGGLVHPLWRLPGDMQTPWLLQLANTDFQVGGFRTSIHGSLSRVCAGRWLRGP
jgi:hypothetical protein